MVSEISIHGHLDTFLFLKGGVMGKKNIKTESVCWNKFACLINAGNQRTSIRKASISPSKG